MTAAVSVRDVTVYLDKARILDNVSLEVPPGEWLTIIGPNGAGKSTLLRVLAGLLPFTGDAELSGDPVRRLRRRDRARRVALVPQTPILPPGMAVLDYVLLGRTPYIPALGRESQGDLDAVAAVLSRLDLDRFAGRALETLSGGERQRVFLARALAQGASLLLLDEPTSALDIGHQQDVLELVDELRRGGSPTGPPLTVVATMHELVIAGEYADRLVLLDGGHVVASGTPTEVLTEPNLARHYGARVQILTGRHGPVVVPLRGTPPRAFLTPQDHRMVRPPAS